MTITQKIIASHCKKGFVKPGEVLLSDIDLAIADYATAELAISEFEKYGFTKVLDSKKIALIPKRLKYDNFKESLYKIRNFANKYNIEHFYDTEKAENKKNCLTEDGHCVAGDFIIGDLRASIFGALGAFSFEAGASDLSFSYATGKTWLKVPEAIRVQLDGVPKANVSGMDIILTLIGILGKDGAKNMSLEFGGDSLTFLNMDDRFAIAGMAKECGALNCIFECDYQTIDFINEVSNRKFRAYFADKESDYKKIIDLDLTNIEPVCALLSSPYDIKKLFYIEKEKIKVGKVIIGSDTCGRLSDLRDAARILKGRKISPNLKAYIIPATSKVQKKALEEGLLDIFKDAGCVILNADFIFFPDYDMEAFSSNKDVIATTDRNLIGKMEQDNINIYLLSPASAAVCALNGYLC